MDNIEIPIDNPEVYIYTHEYMNLCLI